jgi:hypothetical protein
MKFFISVLLMALLSFTVCLYLPWWSIGPACFIVALVMRMKVGWAFLAGFISLFLLWFGLSWWISSNNQDILAHRISLLILKKDDPQLLMLLTALMGAIVGGLGALSGGLLGKVIYNSN